ncbi:hypothetical protein ACI3ER_11960 [Bacillus sp. Wb]
MWKEIAEIIKTYESTFGTLAGVAVGSVVTQLVKSSGKLKFFKTRRYVDFKIRKPDGMGGYTPHDAPDKNKATNVDIELELEIYNPSETPKILREIEFCFYKKKRLLFKIRPEDKSTEKFSAAYHHREEIKNISVPPKAIVNLELVKYIGRDNIEDIKECNRLFLEMKDHKDKKHKVFVCDY